MTVDGLKVSRLVISKPQALLQILDHLLNLPTSGVVSDHIDCWQMHTGRDQVVGFLRFSFTTTTATLPRSLMTPMNLATLMVLFLPYNGSQI